MTLTEEDLKSAEVRLRVAGCDDDGWFFVNNQFAGESHDWASPQVFDIKKSLRAGDNVVAVGVRNSWGHGGLKPDVKLHLVPGAEPLPWSRSLFNGLAQIIVQSTGTSGAITLTATAEGFASATFPLTARPCAPRPAVP